MSGRLGLHSAPPRFAWASIWVVVRFVAVRWAVALAVDSPLGLGALRGRASPSPPVLACGVGVWPLFGCGLALLPGLALFCGSGLQLGLCCACGNITKTALQAFQHHHKRRNLSASPPLSARAGVQPPPARDGPHGLRPDRRRVPRRRRDVERPRGGGQAPQPRVSRHFEAASAGELVTLI